MRAVPPSPANKSNDFDRIAGTVRVVKTHESVQLRTNKHGVVTNIMYPMSIVWRSPVPPPPDFSRRRMDPGPDGMYPYDSPIYDQNIPAYIPTKIFGQPGNHCPGLMERLRVEAEGVMAQYASEVERKTADAEKRRLSRFTGKGARKRVDKIIELVSDTMKGLNYDFDASVLYKIIRVHARAKLVSEDQASHHFFRIDKKTLEAMDEEGLEWRDAAHVMASLERKSLISIFHHISSNPGHWELVTEDDIATAIRRSFVISVMDT